MAKNMNKKASDGRVTTQKKAIDNNPADRTVFMEGGRKQKGAAKKGY